MQILLFLVGGSLLVVAAGLGWYGLHRLMLWRVLRRAGTSMPEHLAAAAADGHMNGQVRVLTGPAGPHRGQELTSPVNHEPCVWHRHTITHRPPNPDRRTRLLAPFKRPEGDYSRRPFTVVGFASSIEVEPEAMRVDRPIRRRDKVLPTKVSQGVPGLAGSIRESYVHREWIIRSGTQLIVVGQVSQRGGRTYLRRPRTGPGIISTRTRDQLVGYTLTIAVAGLAGALLVAAVGVMALIG